MNQNRITVNGQTVKLCEYIKDRLYFAIISAKREPRSTPDTHLFSIDDELVYTNYYSDFGPLNLGMLYRYWLKLNSKLSCAFLEQKRIVHYTSSNPKKRANATYLIASYAVIQLNMMPNAAFRPLLIGYDGHPFTAFQDATIGRSKYQIHLIDILDGIFWAKRCGMFNFEDFNLAEYEYYEEIEHGDLNWIIPNKFVAFCGPITGDPHVYRTPEFYVPFFKKNNINTVVRLNKKMYDSRIFTESGIHHFDLYFNDGGVPSQSIAEKFLDIAERAKGAIAVHCKAGLGRTGCLIGAYIMKHYRMTAKEAIAWLRICRPGSVIGHQQAWLENMKCWLWKAGEAYRVQCYGDANAIPKHPFGIYSSRVSTIEVPVGGVDMRQVLEEHSYVRKNGHDAKVGKKRMTRKRRKGKNTMSEEVKSQGIFTPCEGKKEQISKHRKKDAKEIKENRGELTQGDYLNMIKGQRKSQFLKNST